MCGRYSITTPIEAIQRIFDVPERLNLPPRYNVAPTQEVPVVRLGPDGLRHLGQVRWGLVPFWAEDASIGARLINARAESAATKPAFRAAFHKRRCLVVADGFYEWRKPAEKGGRKQPFRIARTDGAPFAFAGLWERWRPKEEAGEGGEALETCTILTTDANETLRPIHDRMPVILDSADYDTWLDPEAPEAALQACLGPYPDKALTAYPISTRVNKVAHDDPEVIVPLAEPDGDAPRHTGGSGQGSLF
jgi:putative SOS response-associated peptidase YedK